MEIVDYVEIVRDADGQYRVRGRSNNGEVVWTTEKYGDLAWAEAVAKDVARPRVAALPVHRATE